MNEKQIKLLKELDLHEPNEESQKQMVRDRIRVEHYDKKPTLPRVGECVFEEGKKLKVTRISQNKRCEPVIEYEGPRGDKGICSAYSWKEKTLAAVYKKVHSDRRAGSDGVS